MEMNGKSYSLNYRTYNQQQKNDEKDVFIEK